jgi:UDP-2,3-diacylglucosamine pyrophosphatase LpxH
MLVFASDIHLTDGSSGTTIDPRAFDRFCKSLVDIIGDPKKSNIKDVEIVLLGDIFDVIRSDCWLRPENNKPQPIRPWSKATDTDSASSTLEDYTKEIVRRITTRTDNVTAMKYLADFRNLMEKDVQIEISYMIGNHDWLINRYPSTRQTMASFLGMQNPAFYLQNPFPYFRSFNEYGVFARHGDYYDHVNYEGDRDASSLGDAIVIDLVSHFPEAVSQDALLGSIKPLVDRVKEIDNVRPILEISGWLQGLCNEYDGIEERLHQIWNRSVDEFFDIDFVKKHGRIGPDFLDLLKMAMRLTSTFSFGKLKEILSGWVVRHFYSKADDYKRYAYSEAAIKSNSAKYVVYGHTHRAEQVPLDTIQIPEKSFIEKIYFNTGTWRKVFEATAFDEDKCEFIGWHVMTFVVFYLESEKEKDRNYEVWSGSLGYGRG